MTDDCKETIEELIDNCTINSKCTVNEFKNYEWDWEGISQFQ